MSDFDLDNYEKKKAFVKTAELRVEGPRRVTIQTVEEADGFPEEGKPLTKELVLVFTDGTRIPLRAQINKDTMRDLFGKRTSGWLGKTIELYCDPSVRNPSGAKVGGIRIARPDIQESDDDMFTSDLELEDTPPPVKGNGAEKARTRRPRA